MTCHYPRTHTAIGLVWVEAADDGLLAAFCASRHPSSSDRTYAMALLARSGRVYARNRLLGLMSPSSEQHLHCAGAPNLQHTCMVLFRLNAALSDFIVSPTTSPWLDC